MKSRLHKKRIVKDKRCDCGCLLARIVDDHVELKCRRCKRVVCLEIKSLERAKGEPVRVCACQAEKGEAV